METAFTPFASLAGGILIGLAALMLMLGHGRIFGATGIMFSLVFPSGADEFKWHATLVAGMLIAPTLLYVFTGSFPAVTVPVSPSMIAIGGVIVGIGASLGSGCTSGHGVCGLSRLSVRSFVAVPTFMATAALTVFITRHMMEG